MLDENASSYLFFQNMTQVNGYKGFVGYSLRELDSDEINVYCLNKTNLKANTLPVVQNQTNFTSDFMIRSFSSGCYYYDVNTGKWASDGIDVYADTNLTHTHCSSNHLTSFAGGLDLLPSTINFQYAFSNSSPKINAIIYSILLLVTSNYILLALWARWMDRRDQKKINVTFMTDNYPSDLYFYELIFYTGDKCESGTNSKVEYFDLKNSI